MSKILHKVSKSISDFPSFPETQAKMPEYTLAEEVYDVMDVIVELGYVLFFGFVAPEVITLFLMSNMLRVHAFGWKLVYTMQRPFPDGASGLGVVFERVFHVMARCAVACNIVLILLTNSGEDVHHDSFEFLKEYFSRPAEGAGRERDWKSMLTVFFCHGWQHQHVTLFHRPGHPRYTCRCRPDSEEESGDTDAS